MKVGIDYSETCGVCGSQLLIKDALKATIIELVRNWRKFHKCARG